MVDAVDAPLDRLIALFGFDGDRCRVLCLAGTQAWRDRRRGTGDNILILGTNVPSFQHYQRIPNKEKTSQISLLQHHCHSVHVSPFC